MGKKAVNKKRIIIVNAILAFLLLILAFTYGINDIREYYVDKYIPDNGYDFLIYDNNSVVQQFSTTDNGINQIELPLTLTDEETALIGSVVVELNDENNNTIQSWTVQKKDINSEGWISFSLEKELEVNKVYNLFVYTSDIKDEKSGFSLNGTESLAGIDIDEGINYISCYYSYYDGYNEGCIFIALEHSYPNYFFVIAVICIFLALNIYLFNINENIESYAWIVIFSLGMVMMAIMSCNESPDEDFHYNTTYTLSNIIMGEENASGIIAEDINPYLLYVNSNSNFIKELNKGIDANSQIQNVGTRVSYIPYPTTHLFPAIGMTIGRMLGLKVGLIFMLARLTNLIAYTAMYSIAIKLMPIKKEIIFLLALNPIGLFQAASLSYDVIINGCTTIFVVLIVKHIYDESNIEWKNILLFAILLLVFAPFKYVYYIHAGLLLAVPYKLYNGKKQKFVKLIVFFISILILVKIQSFIQANNGQYYTQYAYPVDSGVYTNLVKTYSINGFFEEPFLYIKLAIKFVENNCADIINMATGSYLSRMTMPEYLHALYQIMLIGIIFSIRNEQYILNGRIKLIFAIAMITEATAIIAAGFLMTVYGNQSLTGIQGRYFVPCLLPALLAIENDKIKIDYESKIMIIPIFYIYISMTVFVMSRIVYV